MFTPSEYQQLFQDLYPEWVITIDHNLTYSLAGYAQTVLDFVLKEPDPDISFAWIILIGHTITINGSGSGMPTLTLADPNLKDRLKALIIRDYRRRLRDYRRLREVK